MREELYEIIRDSIWKEVDSEEKALDQIEELFIAIVKEKRRPISTKHDRCGDECIEESLDEYEERLLEAIKSE